MQSTSEVLNIWKNKAVLVWRTCLILRQRSWYFCLTFFPGTKEYKSKEGCSTAWRTWWGFFLSQTVTWALKGRENNSVFYAFLKLWNNHIVQELQPSNTVSAPHCPKGRIQGMLKSSGVLPSAGTGLDQAQHNTEMQTLQLWLSEELFTMTAE